MKTFRSILRGPIGLVLTLAIAVTLFHTFVEPYNYLYALEVERQKEADIRAIAAKMNVDLEFLLNSQGRTRFDFRALFAQVGAKLGLQQQSALLTLVRSYSRRGVATLRSFGLPRVASVAGSELGCCTNRYELHEAVVLGAAVRGRCPGRTHTWLVMPSGTIHVATASMSAIDGRARSLHVLSDAGRAHARI